MRDSALTTRSSSAPAGLRPPASGQIGLNPHQSQRIEGRAGQEDEASISAIRREQAVAHLGGLPGGELARQGVARAQPFDAQLDALHVVLGEHVEGVGLQLTVRGGVRAATSRSCSR